MGVFKESYTMVEENYNRVRPESLGMRRRYVGPNLLILLNYNSDILFFREGVTFQRAMFDKTSFSLLRTLAHVTSIRFCPSVFIDFIMHWPKKELLVLSKFKSLSKIVINMGPTFDNLNQEHLQREKAMDAGSGFLIEEDVEMV
jgi:hypothetical protein